MRSILLGAFILSSCFLSSPRLNADEELSALSAEEIRDGWIMLFDRESSFGWTPRFEEDGKVSVDDGILSIEGPLTLQSTSRFGSFEGRLEVKFLGTENAGPVLVPSDPSEDWVIELGSPNQKFSKSWFNFEFVVRGPDSVKGEFRGIHTSERNNINSAGAFSALRADLPLDRSILAFQVEEGVTLQVRRADIKPLNTEPIFDGETLEGWNVLEDGNSVYSVTDEGYLNVKNGRGDIQTTGEYDDFVLQTEIFVNGENLNSGIFFRALPGQYWSGYESQIRNQYEGDDRTKPVDFGTGGIYRRQPSRRVVADDFEWFTKTLLADGNHFAVWVNGYQVSDWTDERPPANNGRNGFKAAPGVISIQGHDPTTDFSFRNIRIAELP